MTVQAKSWIERGVFGVLCLLGLTGHHLPRPATCPGLCFLIGRRRDSGQMDVSLLLGVTVTPKLVSEASSL